MSKQPKLPSHTYRTNGSTVTEKGQITVPVAIRRALNIERATRIAVTVVGDQLHFQVERRAAATS